MSIHYSPPHVVHEAYARSVAPANVEALYMKLSHEVYVIERRIDALEFARLEPITSLTLDTKAGGVKRVSLTDLYKPVYFGAMIDERPGYDNPVAEPLRPEQEPVSWWLRMEFVEASERIRFPMLPAKVNMTEWFTMGELRELYSYDGFGFSLRDKEWGRE